MKATKIVGAVLGVLLVATLFTGAVAADSTDRYFGTVYAYGLYSDLDDGGYLPSLDLSKPEYQTWTNANGKTVNFLKGADQETGYWIDGAAVEEEGDYTLATGGYLCHITVKQPTAAITGSVYNKKEKSDLVGALIGSTVQNDKFIVVNYNNIYGPIWPYYPGQLVDYYIAFTNPDGTITTTDPNQVGIDVNGYTYLKSADLGTWTLRAAFYPGEKYQCLGDVRITKYAPDIIYGKPYYFTVVSSDDAKKLETTSADGIIQGGYATVVLTAPTGIWNISVEEGSVPLGQANVYYEDYIYPYSSTKDYVGVKVPSSGVVTFSVKADSTSDVKVNLLEQGVNYWQAATKKSLSIKVKSGAVSATAKKDSVYIGNEFDIEGTNDIGGNLHFFIKGTNFPFSTINESTDFKTTSGKVWDVTINTGELKYNNKLIDAGTYTIYAASLNNVKDGMVGVNPTKKITDLTADDMDDTNYVNAYNTVAVAFKQPFITITKAPEVLVQGEKLEVEGNAEGDPHDVQFYIFGTNKFIPGKTAVTDGKFTVELAKDLTKSDNLAAGQYFLVIQHPMYDQMFNIGVATEDMINKGGYSAGDIVINKDAAFDHFYTEAEMGTGKAGYYSQVLFNVNKRQSANAAQALCDALDGQDIDDMYQKASFIVAGATSYVDAIPSTIAKGQVLTISGTTTGHKDEVVSVELLSTAFAAVPKDSVGSASFTTLTTKIGEDGKWSISFDTSGLNADTYTCSVAVGQLDAVSSKVTITDSGVKPTTQPTVTAQPTVQPTVQPTKTAQPTATATAKPTTTPKTPGFGALAALAGLGAVAVLLLRRQ